jgi:hypothetical protein
MDTRELAAGDACGEGRGRRLPIRTTRSVYEWGSAVCIMIFVALPFIAVLFGADPQFVGGVILSLLAVATAGYAMAQLVWEAVSA